MVVLCILVSAFLLLCPHPSLGADIEVVFQEITTLGAGGFPRTEFLPGEEMQVRVGLRVLRSTGNPFVVRLRITGDGWHEIQARESLLGPGIHSITYGGSQPRLYAAAEAGPGKVSLFLDVFSEQETVSLQGRRHEYLTILCPEGLPAGMTARLKVGLLPSDMALTADRRYLYVTSQENRKVTVIDVETKTVYTEIEDPERIGLPVGVAPSPSGTEMLVADAAFQAIHVIGADDHVLMETIRLNESGDLGVVSPGDLAVSRQRNEVYVTDSRAPRIFVVNLAPPRSVREIFLLTGLVVGLSPLQVLLDPENARFVYVLCGGFNEVIKVDVVSDAIVDFVQLRDLQNPSSLWPAWSMAVNPETREIYVLVNPGGFESTYTTMQSKIYALPKNRLRGPRRELFFGSSLWDLVVGERGRFVYAIDSYRGEILVIDMSTQTELYRCAIPVPAGGRLLRDDLARNRLFVGNWAPGYTDIVE